MYGTTCMVYIAMPYGKNIVNYILKLLCFIICLLLSSLLSMWLDGNFITNMTSFISILGLENKLEWKQFALKQLDLSIEEFWTHSCFGDD
jgi:hypothetical protein